MLRGVAADAALPAFAGLDRVAEDVAGENAAMTRRATRIRVFGRRFGDRRRRGDRGRRLGDANRLRRGARGGAGAEPAAWRAPAASPPSRLRRRGGRRLDQARQDAPGSGAPAARLGLGGRPRGRLDVARRAVRLRISAPPRPRRGPVRPADVAAAGLRRRRNGADASWRRRPLRICGLAGTPARIAADSPGRERSC